MDAKIYSLKDADVIKTITLPAELFESEVNEHNIYDAVTAILNNKRQGTASTRTRAEKRGGGKKPWRQKGLGRARAGSIRSPLWVGGGVTFGPKPKTYNRRINKKVKRNALISALSLKAKEDRIFVLGDYEMEQPKTKTVAALLKAMNIDSNSKKLFVFDKLRINEFKSIRNVKNALSIFAHELNAYTVMNTDYLIISEEGLEKIKEVFGK